MKEQILKIIRENPKRFSQAIKLNPQLNSWVLENSLISSDSYSEMIYSALHKASNICSNGKLKHFQSINLGYGGCGPAKLCECTRNAVSNNVKKSKSLVTPDKQKKINEKRRKTNIEKYGVSCVAQTEENRQKFKNWYADPKNVEKMLDRIRNTNIEKYGVENCKSLPEIEEKIIATCLARYGVTNVAQIPSTKAKLRARTAEYKLTGHLLKKGYEKFKNYIEKNNSMTLLTSIDDYKGVEQTKCIQLQCKKCNKIDTFKFYYTKDLRCSDCDPKKPNFTSNEEQEVFDYITKELGILGGKQGDKTVINPYEIDMIFPNEKIAVEYCGLYWHSEHSSGKDKNYHRKKLDLVNACGYRLITIFSDEWNQKKSIVKSKLANILNKTKIRHYARNLTVKKVSDAESKEFQMLYHLQGASSAKINVGLYDKDQLVALMTFSNGRAALNSKAINDEYELVRFVTDGSSVVGGASKLLRYFIRTFNPKIIISYADCRWSEGNLYRTLGFEKITKPTIGYWYVDEYKCRLHRFNFTKQALIRAGNDPSLTEWEIMQFLGYDRIWDCGHQKFVLKVN